VDDNFCVGIRAEDMSVCFEFATELQEVIDFAVKNHPDAFILIRHGLMTAAKIDNRKPAKAKPKRSGDVVAFIVRTTMDQCPCHRFDVPAPDGRQRSEVILTANAAHVRRYLVSRHVELVNATESYEISENGPELRQLFTAMKGH
jgi:hypothetical protein